MASNPPTISQVSAKRPWYKKKRYIIPLSIVLGFGFLGALLEPVEEDGDPSADGETPAEAEQARPAIVEGIMPDYVGFSAAQVAETLEDLDIRGSEVDWPTRFEPRDEEFAEEANNWFVCEQEQRPGEELDISYKLWLGWGKNCDTYKVVPDIVGMAGGDAYDLARSRGLTVDYSSTSRERPFCTQDISAGTKIPAGKLDRDETEINGVLRDDCEAYFAEQAIYEAEEKQRAEEKAARAERERILNDPNTFEGGRRFINFHTDWLRNDIALIDEYRRWLEAGAVIDDPDSWGGPILDALFGDIPSMPRITDDMWEEAPDDYQERWDDIRQRLDEADEAHDEAQSLRSEDVYSISEELPYVADVRALVVEALRLVESVPYPQQ